MVGQWAATTGLGGIDRLIQCDLSPAMAAPRGGQRLACLAADKEYLPFACDRFRSDLDASISPGQRSARARCSRSARRETRRVVFLAVCFGLGTLSALRYCLISRQGAKVAPAHGFSPLRLTPRRRRSVGNGAWVSPSRRGHGDRNCPLSRCKSSPDARPWVMGESTRPAHSATTSRAGTLWRPRIPMHSVHGEANAAIPARFRLLFLTGWSPH